MRIIFRLCLLITSLLAVFMPVVALAQEEQPEENIMLASDYPRVENIAGQDFIFAVGFKFDGSEPRTFDLKATAPKGWEVYMTPQYETGNRISAIRIEPNYVYGNKIRIVATAPGWPLPDTGDYKITLEASSGELVGTTELTAVITARYSLAMMPTTELYNTTAKSGKDNYFSLEVGNLGTAPIDNIKFSPTKPEGWTIDFNPEKIEVLEAFDSQTIDVNIKPPSDTIAGDYEISIRASGTQASTNAINFRVTVESSTIWGWVGVGIIVLVIAGLVVIFMRFSRR